MIISKNLTLSDAQNITGTGDTASTNIIDLGAPGTVAYASTALERDIGKGQPVPLVVQLEADSTGTGQTLDVKLQTDADEAFSNPTDVAVAPQLSGGVAGDRVGLYWITEGMNEQYMRLLYTLGGTSPDYTIDAYVVGADQTND